MKEIQASKITETVERLCYEAAYNLGEDVEQRIREMSPDEESEFGKYALEQILENICYARAEGIAICQDTGTAVIFAEVGQDVHITGGSLYDAINEGVRRGYQKGFLRKSICSDPIFDRKNTGDNTPAVIHTRIVPGNKLRIIAAPKGFGSENKSAIKMFTPAATARDVSDFVVETVQKAGGDPCPPIVVGVGIGGTFESAALDAKRALTLPADYRNPDERYAALEEELLERINSTGIGPQGFGGRTTALAVKIIARPTHIAGLPVAVNIGCHVTRHAEGEL